MSVALRVPSMSREVLLVDRAARLVFRFPDLPDPAAIAAMMRQLATIV
jgi:hypothetical protein